MYGQVFINYRGRDGRSYAALLYVELSRRFGTELVFLDSHSLAAGTDFAAELPARARQARAMLAVIGPGWLAPTTPWWRRSRSGAAVDWTGRELAEAFAAGVRVIPVLTDGASLPTERELPACLAPLSRCQYRRLRCGDATADLDRIVTDLVGSDPELAYAARWRPAAGRPAGTRAVVARPRAVAPHGSAPRMPRRAAGRRSGG